MMTNIKDSSTTSAGVLVVAEQENGTLLAVTKELIGEGRKIADRLGCPLEVAFFHFDSFAIVDELRHYPVDTVLEMSDRRFSHYRTEIFCEAVSAVIRAQNPDVVLFGATENGRDLAPRVAATLHTGLTADCTILDVDLEKRRLLQTRPAFGGNLMATIVCPTHRPQMASVRPGVMAKALRATTASASHKNLNQHLPPLDTLAEVLRVTQKAQKAAALSEAEIIVAGGRGLGEPAGFTLLGRLADTLGATLGASRAAVEAGWIGKGHQVGQTGTSVKPRLYIACGISGAIQHLAGMQGSDCIVAINTNPDAPILRVADFSIVGRYQDIVPKLIAALQSEKD